MIQEEVHTKPFSELPAFSFTGHEPVVYEGNDLRVSWLKSGRYTVYKLHYLLMPACLPDSFTYLVYDTDALRLEGKKVFYLYNAMEASLSLGQGTYDIGLLFSGGRVYADKHFLAMAAPENQ